MSCIQFIVVLIGVFSCQRVIADGAKVERLHSSFGFTEGPAVDKQGNIYFTDQPNNRILKWSTDGVMTVVSEYSGRANGLFVSNNGSLLSCSDMDNELWDIDLKTGKVNILVADFEGKRLNGPNDLWQEPKGGIYFTDPLYPRDYWTRSAETEQPVEGVYYLDSDLSTVTRVVSDLVKPNGIVGTPDGQVLYIADIGDDKTYRYNISGPGKLTNKTLFANMGSDGLTIDSNGNVYLVGNGVNIFNSYGELLEHVPINANWTANVCFGGADFQTLFITASEYLYSLRMNVKGVRW